MHEAGFDSAKVIGGPPVAFPRQRETLTARTRLCSSFTKCSWPWIFFGSAVERISSPEPVHSAGALPPQGGVAGGRAGGGVHLRRSRSTIESMRGLCRHVRCRRHDGCRANAAVGACITSRTAFVFDGKKIRHRLRPHLTAERRSVGRLAFRRGSQLSFSCRALCSSRNFLGARKSVQDFLSPHLFQQSIENFIGHFTDQDHTSVAFESVVIHGDQLTHGSRLCFAQTQRLSANVPVQ